MLQNKLFIKLYEFVSHDDSWYGTDNVDRIDGLEWWMIYLFFNIETYSCHSVSTWILKDEIKIYDFCNGNDLI